MSEPKILAFSVSYGERTFLAKTVKAHRARAGCWFDWLVALGDPSPDLLAQGEALLNDPERMGIQHLQVWPENRGQHHAMALALKMAREAGYDWLLRIDDDVQPKTKAYLATMVKRLNKLKELAGGGTGDDYYRLVASPRVIGLRNRLQPKGRLRLGQRFQVEVMELLGGACRLHPVDLLAEYEPPLWDPLGRGDPQALAEYLNVKCIGAMQVCFPDLRVKHPTDELESADSGEQRLLRKMGYYWPYIPSSETV